jgi:flagellar protein FlaG
MSLNTGEIQPIASGPWVAPEADRKEVQVIAPVAKTQGGTSAKIGEDKMQNDTSGSMPKGFTDEVVRQLQSMLGENTSLNFQVDGKGKTIIKVMDRQTGKVIRQIPSESMVKIQQKLEELRGILFDDKV